MTEAPQRAEKVLAWALVSAAVVSVIFYAVISPWQAFVGARDEIDRAAVRAARYELLAAQKPAFEAALQELKSNARRWSRSYLRATEGNIAAAELQRHVTQTLRPFGIAPDRVEVKAVEDTTLPTGVRKVSAQLQFSTDYSYLVSALAGIESGSPMTVVEQLTLRPVTRRGSRRTSDAREISVQLELSAFYLNGEVSP